MALSGIGAYGYYGYGQTGSAQSLSSVLDSARQSSQSILAQYESSTRQVKTLTKESAAFLNQYTGSMNNLRQAADKLTGSKLDALLKNNDGEITDATIKRTVDAMKSLVQAQNDGVKVLNDNADRGVGVLNQMARMVDDPAAKQKLEMVGLSVNKDGTLALDEAKMTQALTDASKANNPGQMNLLKDVIGGYGGIALNIRNDADAGLREPAAKLIGNDIAKMQSLRDENPIQEMWKSIKGNPSLLNNMAASMMMSTMSAGMMMNILA